MLNNKRPTIQDAPTEVSELVRSGAPREQILRAIEDSSRRSEVKYNNDDIRRKLPLAKPAVVEPTISFSEKVAIAAPYIKGTLLASAGILLAVGGYEVYQIARQIDWAGTIKDGLINIAAGVGIPYLLYQAGKWINNHKG